MCRVQLPRLHDHGQMDMLLPRPPTSPQAEAVMACTDECGAVVLVSLVTGRAAEQQQQLPQL